jgi:hypothetical protein
MPAKTEKQRNFFYAVKNCQEKGKCPTKKIKDTASSMTRTQVQDFTHLEGHKITSFKEYMESREKSNCECKCKPCQEGNCKDCTCKNCKCKNCKCEN